jgi:phosphoribosylformylglycinamidine synthase
LVELHVLQAFDALLWLRSADQVALRYAPAGAPDGNPNGSLRDIAGIVNEAGNVLGMMPHPERAVEALLGGTDGVAVLRAFVRAAGVSA